MDHLPRIQVSEQGCREIQSGGVILRPNHIDSVAPDVSPGDLVHIASNQHACCGIGYFNPASRLPLRILTTRDESIDTDFWKRRFESAHRFRRQFFDAADSYRLIYGESDNLPGLVVDRFSDILVIQVTTLGMERLIDPIVRVLCEMFSPRAVILAADSQSRLKEGLPLYRKIIRGDISMPFAARVDGVTHYIDPLAGHKTGFFLDHRVNRLDAARLSKGRRVLDMFCYSGAFAIRAALEGASRVTAIDLFDPAIELGRRTAVEHGIPSDRCVFIRNEASRFLQEHAGGAEWDLIFLDPPSLVRGVGRAQRNTSNYRKINRLALQCLAPQGILVTSICSFHTCLQEFKNLLTDALTESGRQGRIFKSSGAGPDHPVRPGLWESEYLKCLFIQMFD